MTNARWWWLVGVVLGCGKVVPAPDGGALDDPDLGAASGTRLKLQWYELGGVRALAPALFDAERHEACLPRTWNDGRTYCMPDAQPIVFSDARCSQPAARSSDDPCATTAYVIDDQAARCGTPTHLYQLGGPLAVGQYYVALDDGTCSGPFPSALRAVAAEVPRSALVELAATAPAARGRLARRFLITIDGARVPSGAHDAVLDTDCALQADGSRTGRCVPLDTATSELFGDAACATPVASARHGCGKPRYIARPRGGCATEAFRYFAAGEAIAPASVFSDPGAGCTATPVSPIEDYYELGAELVVASVTRERVAVPGQAVQRIGLSDGATRLYDARLYDVAHDAECSVATFADGARRCIALDAFVRTYYRDASCTQPVELAPHRGPASCGLAPPRLAYKELLPPPGTCGLDLELHDVGPAYSGPVYDKVGGCGPADATRTYYTVGPGRSVDELPRATLVVDP